MFKETPVNDKFDIEQIDKISYCDKEEDIQAAMTSIIKNLGFQRFIYAFFIPGKATCSSEKVVISGYPEEWRSRYKEKDYTFIDPVTKYCMKNVTPIPWSGLNMAKGSHENKVISEAKEGGLNDQVQHVTHQVPCCHELLLSPPYC